MKRIIVALILAGLMAIATAVPAFADIPPADAVPGDQDECIAADTTTDPDGFDPHDPRFIADAAPGNDCGP